MLVDWNIITIFAALCGHLSAGIELTLFINPIF